MEGRVRLLEAVFRWFHFTFETDSFPSSWELYTWCPRYDSEYRYAENLSLLTESECSWPLGAFSQNMILSDRSILPEGFRAMSRAKRDFYRAVRKERLGSHQSGHFVPYHMHTSTVIKRQHWHYRFVPIPA